MRVAALISGGKDSCYNMMQCIAAGHQIVALANLRPAENQVGSDELDSYMYQTVGHHAIDLYAEAMALPLYRRTIRGRSVDTSQVYTKCEGDEVEDLYELLKLVKEKEEVEGISVGAILSDYQRVRVENVCKRLDLQPLAYLWQRKQEDLLREMISSNIQAIIIKVAALGLDPDKHLGKTLDQMEPYLLEFFVDEFTVFIQSSPNVSEHSYEFLFKLFVGFLASMESIFVEKVENMKHSLWIALYLRRK
uniref:Diphthine--ammonia ligase n=1 Tax=Equus caballus TaxID=9796 RepID=A0A9L0R0F5_HORSE